MASSSASATSSLDQSGGSDAITINKPNTIGWIVGGVALLIVAFLFLKRRK